MSKLRVNQKEYSLVQFKDGSILVTDKTKIVPTPHYYRSLKRAWKKVSQIKESVKKNSSVEKFTDHGGGYATTSYTDGRVEISYGQRLVCSNGIQLKK